MKRLRVYPLIPFAVLIIGAYIETLIVQQLFTENAQSESFRSIGTNGMLGCVLGVAIFMAIIRLCMCLNMLITPQINYLKTEKHNRKIVFVNHSIFFVGAFVLAILPAVIIIWKYAMTSYAVYAFAYLFAILVTFVLAALVLYRPFLYPRIDDVVQSYCYFLALLYFTLFLPFSNENKTILFCVMSSVFFIFFIWFLMTKGLFLRQSKKFKFKEKIYQVSREHGSVYLRKYIIRTGTMSLKVSRKYGHFAMNTTYYTENNIPVISEWKQNLVVQEPYIICDVPFYEELRKAKLEYRIKATIIVITDGENKFDMLPHLPEEYHIFIHNFLQYA